MDILDSVVLGKKTSGVPDLPPLFYPDCVSDGSHSGTLGLALLLLLSLVLRLGLVLLERLGDVLCSLVGQTVVVDRLLSL